MVDNIHWIWWALYYGGLIWRNPTHLPNLNEKPKTIILRSNRENNFISDFSKRLNDWMMHDVCLLNAEHLLSNVFKIFPDMSNSLNHENKIQIIEKENIE